MNEFVFNETTLVYLIEQLKNNLVTQEEKAEILEKFGGKSFKFVTQAEYDNLSAANKNDATIMYFITDAQPIQADWNESNTSSKAYIKNKITKLSELENDLEFDSKVDDAELSAMLTNIYGFTAN